MRQIYLSVRPLIVVILHKFIDGFIICTQLLDRKKYPAKIRGTDVYITISRNTFAIGLLAIASLDRQIPGLRYIMLDNGDFREFHKWVIKHLSRSIRILPLSDYRSVRGSLQKYPHLLQYFDYGWSGAKFFIPLLRNRRSRFIILDVDILFYRFPTEVFNWIQHFPETTLYLHDYKNFSVLSSIEISSLLHRRPRYTHINSGFLCINSKRLFAKTTLKQLDRFLSQTLEIVQNRMVFDLESKNPIMYVYPIIEQTLYGYLFNKTQSAPLCLPEYVMFSEHKKLGYNITTPCMIHFAGEGNVKESLYRYLLMSLYRSVINIYRNTQNPWYLSSSVYCLHCKHLTRSITNSLSS
jgi:hypothetical protein